MINDEALTKLGISRTVYSLLVPETTLVLDKLWTAKPHSLYSHSHLDKQDEFHGKFLETWLKWSSPILRLDPALKSYFYPTAGSSEAIRDSIASHAVRKQNKNYIPTIHIFYGEYEGYSAYAKAFGVRVIKHDRRNYIESIKKTAKPGDLFYISQPSSVDGNVWGGFNEFCLTMLKNAPYVKLMVDLCYVGTVSRSYTINLNYPNIEAAFFSLSKVFGVYYHRIGGMLSRSERPSLYGNMWFKNMFSLKFGIELMSAYSVFEIPNSYRKLQGKVIALITPKFRRLQASDVTILAHQEPSKKDNEIERYFTREKGITRVCLTPRMDELVNKK